MNAHPEQITYSSGRLQYHPNLHPNRGKPFTEEELEYLCAFYEYDGYNSIALALGRTAQTVKNKYNHLKRRGLVQKYKNQYWQKVWED